MFNKMTSVNRLARGRLLPFTFYSTLILHKLVPHVVPTYTRNINCRVISQLTMCPIEQVKDYYDDLKKDVAFNDHILNVYKIARRLDFGQLACLAEVYVLCRILQPESCGNRCSKRNVFNIYPQSTK